MANLLPQQYFGLNKKERRARVGVVVCISLFVSLLSGAVFLFPSIVLLFAKVREAEQSVATTRALIAKQEDAGILVEARHARDKIERLEKELGDVMTSEILQMLDNSIPSGVAVTSITYKNIDGEEDTIQISGTAETRENLLLFTRQLGHQELLGKVNLPVSNLAEESDIDFSLGLIVADEPAVVEQGGESENGTSIEEGTVS